jgi:ubiquinone/menaquinone biosynthesis methyltransferase
MSSLASEGADVRGLFNRVARRYDAANRVMSAGVDVLWRRKAIGRLLDGADQRMPLTILDLGAGTLDGALEITRRHPGTRVVGADFAREMLRFGRRKLGRDVADRRIATHAADGHHLPYRDRAFDAAFSGFCVRNLAALPVALGELRRVVRPGGRVVILEFFRPERRRFFFDTVYNARVLPLLGWAVTGDRDAYRYLPESIAHFVSLAEFSDALRAAGFASVEARPLFPSGVASMVVAS